MLNPAKLTEVITLSSTLVIEASKLQHVRINDREGHMQAMAYPNEDGSYEVEAYPIGGEVGVLDWENLSLAKAYCAAKMLGCWDEIAELHPSNRTSELPSAVELAAKADEILSTITTSGGGNPRDTDYSWTGQTRVADGSVWFQISHPVDGDDEWLNGEFTPEDKNGCVEHVFRKF